MDPKGDIFRKTLKILCQHRNCECTLQTLNESLKKDGLDIDDNTGLTKSFENYTDIIDLSNDQSLPTTVIRIKAKVKLCEDFQNPKAKCSAGDGCNGLHICKAFLLSDSCTFQTQKRSCIYGHNFDTPHNKKILRSFCLDRLDISEIRIVLKCPRNRIGYTTPQLCYQYQRKSCDAQKKCRYLHLCRNFLAGTCKSDDCSGHDVFSEGTVDLLKKYGIDVNRSEKEIIADLTVMGVIAKGSPKSKPQPDGEESSGMRKERGRRNKDEVVNGRNSSNGTRQRNSKSLSRQSRSSTLSTKPQQMIHKSFGSTQIVQQPPYLSNQQDMPYQYGNPQGRVSQYQNQPSHTGPYPPPNQGLYPPPNPGQYPGQNYYGPPNQLNPRPQPLWPQTYPYQGQSQPNEWNTGFTQSLLQQQQQPPNYPVYPTEFQQRSNPQSVCHGNNDIPPPGQQEYQQIPLKRNQDQNEKATGRQTAKTPVKQPDKTSGEICLSNFKTCYRKDNCIHHHSRITYQWQYKVKEEKGQPWRDFDCDSNTEVEMAYSVPSKDECPVAFRRGEIVTISFDEMTGTSKRTKMTVRRLSTPSSEAPHVRPMTYKWTTLWKWFWKNKTGAWIEYGDKNRNGFRSHKKSEVLEQAFLANPKGSIEFVTTDHQYKLMFETMVQINTATSKQRPVRRRPKFFTIDELKNRIVPNFQPNNKSGPSGWSIGQSRNQEEMAKHYAEVKVEETTDEYKKISDLFFETLPTDRKIRTVERIENGELWMSFDNQREKMTRKAGKTGALEERHLFHGTTHDKIEAICRQGFDFRFSGFRVGAILGRGSYFAKESKYSDSYAEKSDQAKKMFVVRVLAGEFTKGDKSYVRPPPKSTDNPHDLYDSCVDNVADPKIFVVFTVDQAYPEYIITYT